MNKHYSHLYILFVEDIVWKFNK